MKNSIYKEEKKSHAQEVFLDEQLLNGGLDGQDLRLELGTLVHNHSHSNHRARHAASTTQTYVDEGR